MNRPSQELRYFFTALGYFTRVPVPRWVGFEAHYLNAAARYFPLIGVLVGGLGAVVYLAALQVFCGYEASVATVGSDDAGMRVDELEAVLRARAPKLIYLTPTFQNPKGTTLSLERRQRLVQLSSGVTKPCGKLPVLMWYLAWVVPCV